MTLGRTTFIGNAARQSGLTRVWAQDPAASSFAVASWYVTVFALHIELAGPKASGVMRCCGHKLISARKATAGRSQGSTLESPRRACMSSAISVSPLLALLLLKLFFAPRTLSSMIGGSGMPTCRPRRKLRKTSYF